MSAEDEARAAAYRASLAARAAFQEALQESLAGSEDAKDAVETSWAPMREGLGFHPVEGVE